MEDDTYERAEQKAREYFLSPEQKIPNLRGVDCCWTCHFAERGYEREVDCTKFSQATVEVDGERFTFNRHVLDDADDPDSFDICDLWEPMR